MNDSTDHLRASLEARYGPGKADTVFASMVGAARGPFAPGNARYGEHVAFAQRAGVVPFVGKGKPPTTGPGARSGG